jgi:hypothetical protein
MYVGGKWIQVGDISWEQEQKIKEQAEKEYLQKSSGQPKGQPSKGQPPRNIQEEALSGQAKSHEQAFRRHYHKTHPGAEKDSYNPAKMVIPGSGDKTTVKGVRTGTRDIVVSEKGYEPGAIKKDRLDILEEQYAGKTFEYDGKTYGGQAAAVKAFQLEQQGRSAPAPDTYTRYEVEGLDYQFKKKEAAEAHIVRTQQAQQWKDAKRLDTVAPSRAAKADFQRGEFLTPEVKGAALLTPVATTPQQPKKEPELMRMGVIPDLKTDKPLIPIGFQKKLFMEEHRIGPLTIDLGKPFRTAEEERRIKHVAQSMKKSTDRGYKANIESVKGLQLTDKITVTVGDKSKTMTVAKYKTTIRRERQEEINKIISWEQSSIKDIRKGKKTEMYVTGGLTGIALGGGAASVPAGTLFGRVGGALGISTVGLAHKEVIHPASKQVVDDMLIGGQVTQKIAAGKVSGMSSSEAVTFGLTSKYKPVKTKVVATLPYFGKVREKDVLASGISLAASGTAYHKLMKASQPVLKANAKITPSSKEFGVGFKQHLKKSNAIFKKATSSPKGQVISQQNLPYPTRIEYHTVVSPKGLARTRVSAVQPYKYKSLGYSYTGRTEIWGKTLVGKAGENTFKVVGESVSKSRIPGVFKPRQETVTQISSGKFRSLGNNFFRERGGQTILSKGKMQPGTYENLITYGRPYGKYPHSEIVQKALLGKTLQPVQSRLFDKFKGTPLKTTFKTGKAGYIETGHLRSMFKTFFKKGPAKTRYTSNLYHQKIRFDYPKKIHKGFKGELIMKRTYKKPSISLNKIFEKPKAPKTTSTSSTGSKTELLTKGVSRQTEKVTSMASQNLVTRSLSAMAPKLAPTTYGVYMPTISFKLGKTKTPTIKTVKTTVKPVLTKQPQVTKQQTQPIFKQSVASKQVQKLFVKPAIKPRSSQRILQTPAARIKQTPQLKQRTSQFQKAAVKQAQDVKQVTASSSMFKVSTSPTSSKPYAGNVPPPPYDVGIIPLASLPLIPSIGSLHGYSHAPRRPWRQKRVKLPGLTGLEFLFGKKKKKKVS